MVEEPKETANHSDEPEREEQPGEKDDDQSIENPESQAHAKKRSLAITKIDKRRKISTTKRKKSRETRTTINDSQDLQTETLYTSSVDPTLSGKPTLSVNLQPDGFGDLPLGQQPTDANVSSSVIDNNETDSLNADNTDLIVKVPGGTIPTNRIVTACSPTTSFTSPTMSALPMVSALPITLDSQTKSVSPIESGPSPRVGRQAYDKKLWKHAVCIDEKDLPEGPNTVCYPYEFYLDEEELKRKGLHETEEKIQMLLRDFWTRWNIWDGRGNSAKPGKHILVCYPYAELPIDKVDQESFQCHLCVEPTKGNSRVKGPWIMTNDKSSGPAAKPAKSVSGFWKKYLRRVMGSDYDEKLKPELSNDPNTYTTNDVYRVNRVFVKKQNLTTGEYEFYHVPVNSIITSFMAIKQDRTTNKGNKKSRKGSDKKHGSSTHKSHGHRNTNENSYSESEEDEFLSENHPTSYETGLIPQRYYAYQYSGSQPYNLIGQTVNDRFYPSASELNGARNANNLSSPIYSYSSPPVTPITTTSSNSNGYPLPLTNMQDPTLLTLTPAITDPITTDLAIGGSNTVGSSNVVGNSNPVGYDRSREDDGDDDDMEEEPLDQGLEQQEWAMSDGSEEE